MTSNRSRILPQMIQSNLLEWSYYNSLKRMLSVDFHETDKCANNGKQ